jgi:hypothetical protein
VRKGRLASFARLLAWAYVATLIALALGMRFIGEASWLLTALMYLPRSLFALPLVITLPAVLYAGGSFSPAERVLLVHGEGDSRGLRGAHLLHRRGAMSARSRESTSVPRLARADEPLRHGRPGAERDVVCVGHRADGRAVRDRA